jgi:hypothetical protein
MRYAVIALLLASAMLARPAAAQQFSADIVDGTGKKAGRLYVAADKARIEAVEFPDGFFLVDGAAGAAWFVRPAQRSFMAAQQSSRLTRLFVPLDPGDPCRRWQAMAETAGIAAPGGRWQCDVQGHEPVAGRDAVEYRVAAPGQGALRAWVAPELRIALRLETADGAVFVLEQVASAPQPAALFAIPSGYRKFDPRQLIERLKQSDVWVEPPK